MLQIFSLKPLTLAAKDGRCFVNTSEVTTGNTLLSTAGLTTARQRTIRKATVKVKRVNDQEQIQALVDKQNVIITEDNIRSNLHFNDAEGTACLPNEELFEGLTRMGHKEMYIISSHTKKSFASMRRIRAGFSGVVTPLFDTMMEDASKQGRMIEEIDQDDEIALDADTQERKTDDEMFGVDDLSREAVTTVDEKVSAAPTTNVTEDEITMAQALVALKSVKPIIPATATKVTTVVPTPRAKGIVFHKQKQSHIPTVFLSKDKGKAKMIEPEVPIKKKNPIRMAEEYSRHLEAEEQEATRLSRAQQHEEANISWDNT
uniref:Uncharacterized protein n=1 Tax=Tanacetum cinerariifolium TaxID=118510 RepID=A0A6L2M1M4_TANCI|nr:hypothetical protein [Tanacetum cinerariifolium]